MKKVLSLFLALLMTLSVCAAVPAYAFDYVDYTYCQGKKKGEILGYLEWITTPDESLTGTEEILSLAEETYEKTVNAMAILRQAYLAITEVEKDKTQMEALSVEMTEDWICVAEGLASSMGDPSGCARDIDAFIADMHASKVDAKEALETNNPKTAERALLEYLYAVKRYQTDFTRNVGNMELFYKHRDDGMNMYQRALDFVKKANADVEKANKLLDEATAEAESALATLGSAYAKATALAQNAPEADRQRYEDYAQRFSHADEIRGDLGVDGWAKVSIENLDYFENSRIPDLERSLLIYGSDLAPLFKNSLIPEFFIKANNLTYNSNEQQLVTPGNTQVNDDGAEPITYAVSKSADIPYTGLDWFITDNENDITIPDPSEFSEKIPTAKEAGTYFVYMKYKSGDETHCFVLKTEIKKAPPAPVKPVKKANTLKASGKTVKIKAKTLKKKNVAVKRKKAVSVSKAQGTVTYAKASGSKKIVISKKTGNITVKKGLKKGTYKVKIKVKAAGNSKYKAATKTVTVTVKVK